MLNHLYRKRIFSVCLIIALLIACTSTRAQVNITGPDCILPGTTYQYFIEGKWLPSSTMSVCITGGKLSTGNRCTASGTVTNLIFVIWNDSSSRKITVTSSLGNTNFSVTGTIELKGGQIHLADKSQVYDKNQANYTFKCTPANGGSCSPAYLYQWQRSDNGAGWVDIPGATGKDFQFSEPIIANTFFRRVTTETHSNTIAYSDTGLLSVVF